MHTHETSMHRSFELGNLLVRIGSYLTCRADIVPFVTQIGALDHPAHEVAVAHVGGGRVEHVAIAAAPSPGGLPVVDAGLANLLFAVHGAPEAKGHSAYHAELVSSPLPTLAHRCPV